MKELLGHLWKGLQVGSVTLLVLLLGLALYLFFSGTVTSDGIERAMTALREEPAPEPEPIPKDLEAEWNKIRKVRERQERTYRIREEELKSVEDKSRLDLQRMEKEREDLEKLRIEAGESLAVSKKERKALLAEKIDAVTEANLPIFNKMKGQELADLMLSWRDNEIVRYLWLLPATKSAEVLRAMQQPNGAYSAARLEQIVQTLKKGL